MMSGQPEWIFAYGSLMWRPGFDYAERRYARIQGYHRALCVYSHVHRGTPQCPGLVLGLDRGGACKGMGYRIESGKWKDVFLYLQEREQANYAYREKYVSTRLDDGRVVRSLAFVADRTHRQYAGELDDETAWKLISTAQGVSGANVEYVRHTFAQLEQLGVRDRKLENLMYRMQPQEGA
ncbi:MAG: gamma-glutamylcyclotransferase [Alphaproteobacteria bacterium]|nr:gamma-glutamylcyclotransferase [Alphaproteobacteria bacterium]